MESTRPLYPNVSGVATPRIDAYGGIYTPPYALRPLKLRVTVPLCHILITIAHGHRTLL